MQQVEHPALLAFLRHHNRASAVSRHIQFLPCASDPSLRYSIVILPPPSLTPAQESWSDLGVRSNSTYFGTSTFCSERYRSGHASRWPPVIRWLSKLIQCAGVVAS
ncbi:hypothetical protein E2C01_076316 [Portunus trituberculatus]|uniref:Uncharacterized protein n=1 Tax=Portunus trituberculatus TaxID=210409 RepID=A0A5B7II86_PORTR|nr:hypothetical protein [Portunus trituberculatus]